MKDAYGVNFQSLVQTELKQLIIAIFKAFQNEATHRNRSFEMLEISFMVTDNFKILLNSIKPIKPIKRTYWLNRMYEDSLRGLFELLRQSEIEDMSYFFELIGVKERSERLRKLQTNHSINSNLRISERSKDDGSMDSKLLHKSISKNDTKIE